MSEAIQDRSDLIIPVARGHPADNVQCFHGGGTVSGRAWTRHFNLGVHSALPVDGEVKRYLRFIGADDDLFKYGSEDHLLKFSRTAISFPYRRKVLAHRSDLHLFLSGQRMPHSIELGKPMFCPRYFLQLLVPATF